MKLYSNHNRTNSQRTAQFRQWTTVVQRFEMEKRRMLNSFLLQEFAEAAFQAAGNILQ